MSRKKTLIKGTFILTLTGVISRCIGFGQRMFLSQIFGPEGVGIYQLIFPVYGLFLAFTTGGIQTSVSRSVSSKIALGDEEGAKSLLKSSLILSTTLSLCACFVLRQNASYIATYILGTTETTELLMLLAYAFPFASIHGCIMGYYFGMKQTMIPSACQLLEQIFRVGSIYILYLVCIQSNISYGISLAVIGLVLGEIVSALFSLLCINGPKVRLQKAKISPSIFTHHLHTLLPMAIPLTANRVIIGLLHSIEAISIPSKLEAYGLSTSQALSTYGILVGMALPCLLFPTAITSSVATVLLPTVAEIQAIGDKKEMKQIVHKTMQYCTALGILCLISFLICSNLIADVLFHTPEVASFLNVMAWLCPFLYLNTTMVSILNGLGKPTTTFILNTLSLLIRIACVFILIPSVGIYGYLWGMLISQIFITIGCYFTFRSLCLI